MNFNLKQNPAPLAQVFALGPPVERPQVPENRPNSRRYTYRTRTNWWQTTCYEPRYLVSREVCMPRFAVLCSILLLSVLSFGQNERAIARYCPYGCGPYVPLITTPSLSFATVSPNPVGATNATGGLIAGATDSTLSEVSGNTDAVYTLPVWYSGGQTPRISSIVAGSPWLQGPPPMAAPVHEREMRHLERAERTEEVRTEPATQVAWIYFSSGQPTSGSGEAATERHAARSFSNDDVTRQNQKNGQVKYDSKTEKIQ